MVTVAFKLADEAYLLKLGKNLSWNFEVIYIFRKNAVLNICRYLKVFEEIHQASEVKQSI